MHSGGKPLTLTDDTLLRLPKAELHVHLEGSMPPETLLALGERHGIDDVPRTLDEVRRFFEFRDFAHFIEVYLTIVQVLRQGEDFSALAYGKGAELARHNVRYAEVFFTPPLHTRRGVPADEIFEGLEEGRQRALAEHGVEMVWMADIPGEDGQAGADLTLQQLLDHRPPGFVALGLGGPEIGTPRPQFAPHFDAAIAAGYHSVVHAGETTGPQTIRDALEYLHAERIGHGTSLMQDPALVEHVVRERIPVDVSVTSNLCTRAVASLDTHPLPQMAAAGVNVTINSDDPPMFGTDLSAEYRIARDLLDAPALLRATRAGFENSLLPEDRKAAYLMEFDAVIGG
ncbi:adenosine deaminase [Kineosporia mesophila]|uniref:Adenosine deaminase n=1 Tax=Kineosporia mesophila TaxID=566012 RepID=A0ABP6ZKQ4_9ACTN|nr:adenosine deaminase [Kineosporia mesophila]MCD5349450.1 adenosine deaminase [Kineosporia mesophila]